MVSVLVCVGFILFGMIEELGLFFGKISLFRLDRGLDFSRCMLLVILNSDLVMVFSVLEKNIIVLCVVSVLNLFGVVMNGRLVILVIFVVMVVF